MSAKICNNLDIRGVKTDFKGLWKKTHTKECNTGLKSLQDLTDYGIYLDTVWLSKWHWKSLL